MMSKCCTYIDNVCTFINDTIFLVGGFKHSLIFHSIWESFPLTHFSRLLKPPTSFCYWWNIDNYNLLIVGFPPWFTLPGSLSAARYTSGGTNQCCWTSRLPQLLGLRETNVAMAMKNPRTKWRFIAGKIIKNLGKCMNMHVLMEVFRWGNPLEPSQRTSALGPGRLLRDKLQRGTCPRATGKDEFDYRRIPRKISDCNGNSNMMFLYFPTGWVNRLCYPFRGRSCLGVNEFICQI